MGKKVLNSRKELYTKIVFKTLWIGVLAFLVGLNVFSFIQKFSVNPEKITEYQSVKDPLERYRNPLQATVFYHFEKQNDPKIIVFDSAPESNNTGAVLRFMRPILNHKKLLALSLPETTLKAFAKYAKKNNFDFTIRNLDTKTIFKPDFKHKLNDQNTVLLVFDNTEHIKQQIITLARQNSYKPKVFPIYKTLSSQPENFQDDDLKKELSNLRDFIKDHQSELQTLIKDPFSADFKDTGHFHDRSSIVVRLSDTEYGFLDFEHSLVSAYRKIYSQIKAQQKNGDLKVFLLTQMRPNPSSDEAELIRALKDDQGLYLEDGLRRAVMMPQKFQNTQQKQEFLNRLKIKAGLSPDYWSDHIKTYTFYAQEI